MLACGPETVVSSAVPTVPVGIRALQLDRAGRALASSKLKKPSDSEPPTIKMTLEATRADTKEALAFVRLQKARSWPYCTRN